MRFRKSRKSNKYHHVRLTRELQDMVEIIMALPENERPENIGKMFRIALVEYWQPKVKHLMKRKIDIKEILGE